MRLSKQEISVISTVVLFHVLLGAYLAALLDDGQTPSQGNETALIIRWIKRDSIDMPKKDSLGSSTASVHTTNHGIHGIRENVATEELPEQASPAFATRKIDLASPEPKISFDRNPLDRPAPLDTHPNLLSVTFIDRSIGGTLERMTKFQNCKELKKALAITSGDATTIMASMEKEGCIRS